MNRDGEADGLRLSVLPGRLAVCRLDAGAAVPAWAAMEGDDGGGSIVSVSRTAEELSIVCPEPRVPAAIAGESRVERGWRAFKVEGPLDFALTGILARLSGCLAEAGVSIFAISTFDTDYLLVREAQFAMASTALANDFDLDTDC